MHLVPFIHSPTHSLTHSLIHLIFRGDFHRQYFTGAGNHQKGAREKREAREEKREKQHTHTLDLWRLPSDSALKYCRYVRAHAHICK